MAEAGEDCNVIRAEGAEAGEKHEIYDLEVEEQRPLMKDVGCETERPKRLAARRRPISKAGAEEPKPEEERPFITTRNGMFGKEEHLRCAAPDGPKFRGFSFMPTKELDDLSTDWLKDLGGKETNIYIIRGLAVAFFYQSQLSKARDLLSILWDVEGQDDIDIALMLVECECALTQEDSESLSGPVTRLLGCIFDHNATEQVFDEWDKRLIRNGRFMGCIVLHYLLYRKMKEESVKPRNMKQLAYRCLKKSVRHLAEMDPKIAQESKPLNLAIYTFMRFFQDDINKFPDSRKKAYVEALCGLCVARFVMYNGPNDDGRELIENSIQTMKNKYGEGFEKRMLYGDLIAARGFVLFRDRRYRDAADEFRTALSIYEKNMKDHESHPESKDRVLQLMNNYIAQATVFADTL